MLKWRGDYRNLLSVRCDRGKLLIETGRLFWKRSLIGKALVSLRHSSPE